MAIVQKVKQIFDLNADVRLIYEQLSLDPFLKGRMKEGIYYGLPGAWDPFEFSIRGILGQQISVKAATTMAHRIAMQYGISCEKNNDGLTHYFPNPGELENQSF